MQSMAKNAMHYEYPDDAVKELRFVRWTPLNLNERHLSYVTEVVRLATIAEATLN